MKRKIKILFLCSGNICLSMAAKKIAEKIAPDTATFIASCIYPDVGKSNNLINEKNLMDFCFDSGKCETFDKFQQMPFDIVIILTEKTMKNCPVLCGNPPRICWNIIGKEEEVSKDKTYVYKKLESLIFDFFSHGYFDTFVSIKEENNLLLDNISDAIIAHDLRRKIFYFNEAAENLTGFKKEEVLGKDCHDVFPNGLCGKKCLFANISAQDNKNPKDNVRRTLKVTNKKNKPIFADMVVKLIKDNTGQPTGILATLRDLSLERYISEHAENRETFYGMIGSSPQIKEVFDAVTEVSDSDAPVLITGESGTGKEMVAKAIHDHSLRKNKLFVPVNCGALPENLLESELFGHVKGAFTGAVRDKKGRFELADGGTIFLDEIGDISPAMQVKLLRVLQEGYFERLGAEHSIKTDVRVISATNKDLSSEIAAGRFREDLYYRLCVIPIHMPPLRERGNDVILIAQYLLKDIKKRSNKPDLMFSSEVIDIFLNYPWPGNVRELQNWIQYAAIKCKGNIIEPRHLPHYRNVSIYLSSTNTRTGMEKNRAALPSFPSKPAHGRRKRKRKLNAETVEQALRDTNGNKAKAARLLKVGRATLYRFLNEQL